MENKITQKGKEDMKKHTVTCHSCNSRHNKKPMIITKQNSLPAQAPHERYLVNNLSPLKSPKKKKNKTKNWIKCVMVASSKRVIADSSTRHLQYRRNNFNWIFGPPNEDFCFLIIQVITMIDDR